MSEWTLQFPRDLAIAIVTRVIGSRGFPLSVTYVIPGCFGPGSPLGCLAYDPLEVVLDYVIWVGLSFVTIIFVDWVATRNASGVEES